MAGADRMPEDLLNKLEGFASSAGGLINESGSRDNFARGRGLGGSVGAAVGSHDDRLDIKFSGSGMRGLGFRSSMLSQRSGQGDHYRGGGLRCR